jgi:glycosyltransferase involved in cell wall biosynthesis
MVLHIINNFLPQHTAGIEVYVHRLCIKSPKSNFVLITGDKQFKYEYQGIEVFVLKENSEFEIELTKLLLEKNITCAHYHQFDKGKFSELKTLQLLKKQGIHLKLTFHLVQYYCSTLKLKQNNLHQCKITANRKECSRCYFETNYMDKTPVFLRSYQIIEFLNPINKIKKALNSSFEVVSKNIERFEFIINYFDELETINEDFYLLLKPFKETQNKLTYSPQTGFQKKLDLPLKLDELRLIFLGRIEKSKGIEKLIELAIKLNNQYITIDIFGQINDSKYNESYFHTASQKTNTILNYKGVLKPENVELELKRYNYLIHPSEIAEMTPLVIKEAFKMNLPVIGNNVFGINSYVKDGINGWLLDFNNINTASKFINGLLYKKLQ